MVSLLVPSSCLVGRFRAWAAHRLRDADSMLRVDIRRGEDNDSASTAEAEGSAQADYCAGGTRLNGTWV